MLAHLGGLLAGVSTVPTNFHLNAEEVAYILQDSGTRVLFVGPETVETGLAAARQAGVPLVVGWRCPELEGLTPWEGWLAAADPGEPPTDVAPAPQPHVHVGHDGAAQGRRAAAHHVRRRLEHRGAPRPRWRATRSPASAPTS